MKNAFRPIGAGPWRKAKVETPMKLVVLALALSAAAPNAEAAETHAQPLTLKLKPKAAIAALPRVAPNAPFLSPAGEPELELAPRSDPRSVSSRSTCDADRTLCYDASTGRIVYKPARALMPDIPGLRPENISVKRNRIVFRYSF